jgi:hypothetical protein
MTGWAVSGSVAVGRGVTCSTRSSPGQTIKFRTMYALVAALLSMLWPMSGYAWIRRNPSRAQDLLRGLVSRESILTTRQPAAIKLAKQAGLTV